jgi:2-C-methyl-D-erythritol 4-phosphate cytidylyltransferase
MAVSKAIIVAAGSSRRMGGIDKIFLEIAGKPVLAHSIEVFERSPLITGIIVVLAKENVQKGEELVKKYNFKKVSTVCAGGAERQDSVKEGLNRVGECDFVLIHDGARPCLEQKAIEQGIKEADAEGVAVAASPVTDTIKQVDANERVTQTLDRSKLRSMHTPQVFRADIIKKIHENPKILATDDAALAESMGYGVKIYQDSPENIKITTPEGIIVAESILKRRQKPN